MSETRMSDDEFEGAATLSLSIASPAKINATAAAILVGSRCKTVAEARRARAAETDLAAQLAASQAECERLRSERDAAHWALKLIRNRLGPDRELGVLGREIAADIAAVLSPPAPKGEATEAAK